MWMFILALTVGGVAAVIGFALGSVVTQAYWLAFVLAAVGFVVGFALWEYLINRPGGLRETETPHDPNAQHTPVGEP